MKQLLSVFCVSFLCLIAAVSVSARNVQLDWNASVSTNVTGYFVYYGTASGDYSIKVDVGNATSLTISNLACGTSYYFAATAYDADGNESGYSSEVSFVASGVLKMSAAATPGSPATMRFPVEPGHWYEVQATTDLQNWTSIWQSEVQSSNFWMQVSDPDSSSFASRFYRLVLH